MKTHKALVVGIVLAGLLLMLQSPLRIVAQEPPRIKVRRRNSKGGRKILRAGWPVSVIRWDRFLFSRAAKAIGCRQSPIAR